MSNWTVRYEDVLAARDRIAPYLRPTPLLQHPLLDEAIGHGVRVFVKHENHQPTSAFKVRNALAAMTLLSEEQRERGVVAATRGNHGQALAWAGRRLLVPVTVVVPYGNNPEKNAATRALGAELVEHGRDYDEAAELADQLQRERDLVLIHSTNDRGVLAGAGTITLEIFEQRPDIEALVVAVGGGSQAVGATLVAAEQEVRVPVFAVQAEAASAAHDSWHARRPLQTASADTLADGLATRRTYQATFPALLERLAAFVTVSEAEIADSIRLLLRSTHNLAEGAGATGVAGLRTLAAELAGKRVAVILSGSNIDQSTLRSVLNGEL
jgi:threonine dehydratase